MKEAVTVEEAAVSNPSAVGRQRDIDDTICKPKCGSNFVKNEGGMRDVTHWNSSPLLGARVGIVCHDGSYQYWEMDTKGCFVPFVIQRVK